MKKINIKHFKGGPNVFIVTALIVFTLFVLFRLTDITNSTQSIHYNPTFLNKVKNNEVKSIRVLENGKQFDVYGILRDGRTRFETTIPNTPDIWNTLVEHNVDIDVNTPSSDFWYILLMLGFGLALSLAIWYFFRQTRNSSSGGSNIFSMSKSKAKMFMPSQIKSNFNSVAGAAEAKEELADVVDFLKNPEKFRRLGAKLTKGVLLVGEPGNGKTLLAKAVAGEANCPFFSVSGSDFIEVFVGVGAARVRDLFAQARRHSPSIVFMMKSTLLVVKEEVVLVVGTMKGSRHSINY